MDPDPPDTHDTARAAAEQVLDRLAGGDAPSRIIREGAALLVRRGDVLARVRVDDGRCRGRSPSTRDGDGTRDHTQDRDGDGTRDGDGPSIREGARDGDGTRDGDDDDDRVPGAGTDGPQGDESSAWRVSRREVAVARALAEADIPAARLVEPDGQPWAVGGHIVSAWRWIDPPAGPQAGRPDAGGPAAERSDAGGPDSGRPTRRIDPTGLGELARRLREHGPRQLDHLPDLDPFEAIYVAVGECGPDDPEACFVRNRAQELRTRWTEACRRDPLGRSLVHGDLHADNVILGADGPVLTDFELSGVGGAGYDAAPAAVAVARYGAPPENLDRFIDGFGADPRAWDGFAVYTAVYELWTTAWAVGVRAQNPRWAAEADRRVATLRNGADHRWELN